jgi:tetratricopeptide (TPR) repeat protein
MELTKEQIDYFNTAFERAGKRQSGIVYLDGYNRRPLGFFGKKKLKKSIDDFKFCLELIPDHWQSMVLMAKSYQRLDLHSEAFDLLEKAFTIELDNATIPMEASLEAMHLNKIDKAIYYSEQSIKRKPNDFALLGNHAMNLLVAGKDMDAKEIIDEAIRLNPNDSINKNIEKKISDVISGKSNRPTFKDAIG